MAAESVGMIGLGIMGSAMSANLIRAGFKVVGFDVLAPRRDALRKAGGTPVKTSKEVAQNCAIIVTSLPSSEALARNRIATCGLGSRSPDRDRDKHVANFREGRSANAPRGQRRDATGLPLERHGRSSTRKGLDRVCERRRENLPSHHACHGRFCARALFRRPLWGRLEDEVHRQSPCRNP